MQFTGATSMEFYIDITTAITESLVNQRNLSIMDRIYELENTVIQSLDNDTRVSFLERIQIS